MATAIVTGANGFIGARLVQELLRRGQVVYALGRGRGDTPWRERVQTALADITGRPPVGGMLSALSCVSADICQPNLGLASQLLEGGRAEQAVLFHAAADTRFSPADSTDQRQVNVSGPVNVIRTLHHSLAAAVHVSTAYVAGTRRGVIRETEGDRAQEFHNTYEKSKLEAEVTVTALCGELGLPLTIVRPSVVVNDGTTGRASTWTHLNAVMKELGRMQRPFTPGGESVEFRVPVDPDGRPNLVPVDVVAEAVLDIGLDVRARGRTFHVCHPAPQTNRELLSLIKEALEVGDVVMARCAPGEPGDLTRPEKRMRRSLAVYLPYLSEFREFDMTNTRSVLVNYDARFSPVTAEYLRNVIGFQRSRGRGEGKPEPGGR